MKFQRGHIVDLTYPIDETTPVFPGDTRTQLRAFNSGASDFYLHEITLSLHTGTHIDAARHIDSSAAGTGAIPLEVLVGEAEVIDLGTLEPLAMIGLSDLLPFENQITIGSRVIIKTGWGAHYDASDFFTHHPSIDLDTIRWLAARKPAIIALEQPSLHVEFSHDAHCVLLAAGVVVVESIANAHLLTVSNVYLTALPLKVDSDGSPVRIIAQF